MLPKMTAVRVCLTTLAALLCLCEVESCLQNIPEFKDYSGGGGPTLPLAHTEVIVPAYTFNCSGVLTEWGVYVKPGDTYYIQFQVWRPSTADGCYGPVGDSLLPNARPDVNGQILLPVKDENQFTVQPGDVVGFYVEGTGGVQMATDISDSTVIWYAEELRFTDPGMCMLSAREGRGLGTWETAAPVLTAVVRTGDSASHQTFSQHERSSKISIIFGVIGGIVGVLFAATVTVIGVYISRKSKFGRCLSKTTRNITNGTAAIFKKTKTSTEEIPATSNEAYNVTWTTSRQDTAHSYEDLTGWHGPLGYETPVPYTRDKKRTMDKM